MIGGSIRAAAPGGRMAARLTAYVVVGIVAATLIAGLIVGAQRDDNDGPVDVIIHNAKVYTAGSRGAMAEAVAVRGNQILRVGTDREVVRLRRPRTLMIDAKGGAVLPGFNDAHLRLIDGGLALDQVDLLDAPTLEETQARIRKWAEGNPDRPWVLGGGWHHQAFPDSLPARQMLDSIVADRPVQLFSRDGHMSWVNTKALRLAKVTKQTPDPPNGTIVRDARGEPTGVLKEAAMALVGHLVPQPTSEERASALRAAVEEAHKYGITSVQDVDASLDEFETYAAAHRNGDLKVRVYAALPIGQASHDPSDAELDRLETLLAKYPDDPLFKAGAVELSLDGTVEANSAFLLEPYANRSSSGEAHYDADDLNRVVRRLDGRGWQVLTDAAGDRAVQWALNAYEHAVRSNPEPKRGRRHRIEHADIVSSTDVPRFGALGVIASTQPFLGSPSEERLGLWSRHLGAERGSTGWPLRSIAGKRGHLAFGSDWPAAPLNPMLGVMTAVTRTTPDGTPEDAWVPEERIALKSALDAYTSGAAWASFDEQRKGTIEAGMLADLVVMSDDIFSAPPSRLSSATVEITIFDGKVVFRRAERSTN
jgi:predicted amidohydrolase YtcJ